MSETLRPASGRVIDLNLHLLDRQVVDRDGKMICKVDDVEFDRGADGNLYVAAILVGPRALGRRFRGRLGRWVHGIGERLATGDMPRLDMSLVSEIGSAIKLGAARKDLDAAPFEDWVQEKIISRIPGSHHESG
jgi:sporulation protein YlmC with PRC-barrel domain